ncbi:MAG: hypothetical protein KKE82_09985, partial [Proteobacteria bacterium]|nr:hypothetical protein [Pseudomonadota bacterium]
MARTLLFHFSDMEAVQGKAHCRTSECTEKEVAGESWLKMFFWRGETPQSTGGGPEVSPAPESTSNCLSTGLNRKLNEVRRN